MAKKYFKKALSMTLALTLCLSLAVPAFAAEDEDEKTPITAAAEEAVNLTGKADKEAGTFEKLDFGQSSADTLKGAADAANGNIPSEEDLTNVEGKGEALDTTIRDQQGVVDEAKGDAEDEIADQNEAVAGASTSATEAVNSAASALADAQKKLEALESITDPQEKADAAAEAQEAAEAAVAKAAEAQNAVTTAQGRVEDAQNALTAAKKAYEEAVQAAKDAVDDAQDELGVAVKAAQDKLNDAQTALSDAEETYNNAAKMKTEADETYKAAVGALKAAQDAYGAIHWDNLAGEGDAYRQENVTSNAVEEADEALKKAAADKTTADQKVTDKRDEISTEQSKVEPLKEKEEQITEKINDVDDKTTKFNEAETALSKKIDELIKNKSVTEDWLNATATMDNGEAGAATIYKPDLNNPTQKSDKPFTNREYLEYVLELKASGVTVENKPDDNAKQIYWLVYEFDTKWTKSASHNSGNKQEAFVTAVTEELELFKAKFNAQKILADAENIAEEFLASKSEWFNGGVKGDTILDKLNSAKTNVGGQLDAVVKEIERLQGELGD